MSKAAISSSNLGKAMRRPQLERPPTDEQHARELLGVPREWRWSVMKREGKHPDYWGVTLEGGVYPPKTRGKYKGQPNFRAGTHLRKITITDAMHHAWLREWEASEGKCSTCWGTGARWAGWSAVDGDRYEPCKRCNETGLPPLAKAAA